MIDERSLFRQVVRDGTEYKPGAKKKPEGVVRLLRNGTLYFPNTIAEALGLTEKKIVRFVVGENKEIALVPTTDISRGYKFNAQSGGNGQFKLSVPRKAIIDGTLVAGMSYKAGIVELKDGTKAILLEPIMEE